MLLRAEGDRRGRARPRALMPPAARRAAPRPTTRGDARGAPAPRPPHADRQDLARRVGLRGQQPRASRCTAATATRATTPRGRTAATRSSTRSTKARTASRRSTCSGARCSAAVAPRLLVLGARIAVTIQRATALGGDAADLAASPPGVPGPARRVTVGLAGRLGDPEPDHGQLDGLPRGGRPRRGRLDVAGAARRGAGQPATSTTASGPPRHYFFRWELPKTGPQLDLLASLDRTTLDVQASWFSGLRADQEVGEQAGRRRRRELDGDVEAHVPAPAPARCPRPWSRRGRRARCGAATTTGRRPSR